MNIFNVLVYSSFLMQACMIWADFEDEVVLSQNPKNLSVIMWIKLEFLIFMVNLFSIPGMLALLVLLKWI
jgi:hypothetical protein